MEWLGEKIEAAMALDEEPKKERASFSNRILHLRTEA